jgi:hypothetical protein
VYAVDGAGAFTPTVTNPPDVLRLPIARLDPAALPANGSATEISPIAALLPTMYATSVALARTFPATVLAPAEDPDVA